MLNCMQSAMIKIRVNGSGGGNDKLLRSLLVKKKKYNGLNLACILLEQIILGQQKKQGILDTKLFAVISLI